MSQTDSTSESFAAQMKQIIQSVENDLKRGDTFFEELGLDRDKVRAYFASIETPELLAEAQAAVADELRAADRQAREQLTGMTRPSAETRTRPRRDRNII
ncbi:MAG: hypothetical protein I8H77_14490 [Comamonadaceae bacterium]|nr:hypothetical protein [Comamonadaceae bacterium]